MVKKPYPETVAEFEAKRAVFSKFLVAHGSEVFPPTNPYEVMRFATPEGVGIIYRNAGDRILPEHWQNGAREAWFSYRNAMSWRVLKDGVSAPRTPHINSSRRKSIKAALLKRDGDACFYCQIKISVEELTIEHFIPKSCGGPNHLHNLLLSCERCNMEVGNAPAKEKINFVIERRTRAAAVKQVVIRDLDGKPIDLTKSRQENAA